MNSIIKVLLVTTALAAMPAQASEPTPVLKGITHQALFDLSFDGGNGVAVGAGGQIVVSRDSGKSWTPEKSPSPLSLLGVARRGSRVVAVGQMGLVLLRDSAGQWKQVKTATTERLMAIDMNSRGQAVAVGSFGTVLRSGDGGASWTAAKPDWASMFAADSATLGDNFQPHLYAVDVAENGSVVIAGELSTILRSADGAATWDVISRGISSQERVDPSLFGMDIREDGVGFAVGQSGVLLKTTDAGLSWSALTSGTRAILLGIDSGTDGQVLVTGMREMLRSRDDGASWQHVKGSNISTAWYSAAVRPAGSSTVLAAGQQGTILAISR
ncbi:MAG TPA: YCF48-related protein [Solimonas sp.]|nr:YCF48-related protein [Solimonas sp.]